ncbi:MAG: hypothetical protein IH936_03855 [Acidobacteria bacterium]|nr:hypothetical protein [Acidobacteriota bacterium]
MEPPRGAELAARPRECGEQEMVELLESELKHLDGETVRLALRNPHASKRVIDLILGERRLLLSHKVPKALVQHPKTREARALNLVPALSWSDLAEVGGNTRIRQRVRLAADRYLIERLPRLEIGERVAIARKAGPGVIAPLLQDPDLRVVEALLENPRLTEALLAPFVHGDTVRPEILGRIASDRKWGSRYSIRDGIARNPKTPSGTALKLLAYLKKSDLRDVRADRGIAPEVRRRAGLLLGIDPQSEANSI